jgi:tRNA A37 threonylcarbamoyladenosine dehydratase
MRRRILDIQPGAEVESLRLFYRPEAAESVAWSGLDAIADAMDTVRAKVDLAVQAQRRGIPLVSCMGAGNRLDPTQFAVGDLFETEGCPLCRAVRKKLRRHGVGQLRVVYSREPPREVPVLHARDEHTTARRPTPGSIAFVPSVAGMILAAEVVRLLLMKTDRSGEENAGLARRYP